MRILVVGATGEVGSTVADALLRAGHSALRVSSRAPLADAPELMSVPHGIEEVRSGGVDLVVNCSGRGDRRQVERTGLEGTSAFARAARGTSTPSVLVSTTRVLEGYGSDFREDATARPTTPYAIANAASEAAWLTDGGLAVLRITNYFCAPMTADSPQSLLLPWSLVTEGLDTGSIVVRSGAATTRQFVDADDVARAVVLLAAAAEPPRICATSPGVSFTLGELAHLCQQAVASVTGVSPEAQFGPDTKPAPECHPGWLGTQGWQSRLTSGRIGATIERWLREVIVAEVGT